MKYIGTSNNRSVYDSLISYRPQYYEKSKVVNEITRIDAIELEALYNEIDSVLDQFFINTATWGIDTWERMYDIPSDPAKPIEQRRSVVKSRIRRYGTSTFAMVKNVAESYLNGEVEITEQNNIYNIHIKFAGKRGVPPNIADIKKAIRDVTPAHLGLTYEYTYLAWLEFEKQSYTWDLIDVKSWDEIESSYPPVL